MKITAIATAAAAVLFCIAAQAQVIERIKLTDNEMSCQMIYGEIRQMEAFMAAAPAVAAPMAPAAAQPVVDNGAGQQVVNAIGQQALAQVAARNGLGGLFGGLMGGGAPQAQQQAQLAAVQQLAAAQQSAAAQQALAMAAAQGRVSPATAQGLGSLFGGLSALASQQAAAAQAAPAAAVAVAVPANQGLAQQAAGRKEHLTSLFLGKGCKLSDVSR